MIEHTEIFSSPLVRQGPVVRKAYMFDLVRKIVQGQNLKKINILEVGSWAGSSTITWGNAIKACNIPGVVDCVDIWEPYLDIDINNDDIYLDMNNLAKEGKILDIFKKNISDAGLSELIKIHKGPSSEILSSLQDRKYNIIFIDASHVYSDVKSDIKLCKKLVSENGVICGDDFELPLEKVDIINHKNLLDIKKDFDIDPKTNISYHPGVTQALSEEFDSVNERDGFWAVKYLNKTWTSIDLTNLDATVPEHLLIKEYVRPSEPKLLFEKFGFNIIDFNNEIFACRQSVGAVDLYNTKYRIREKFDSKDVFWNDDINLVILRINNILISELSEENINILKNKESEVNLI